MILKKVTCFFLFSLLSGCAGFHKAPGVRNQMLTSDAGINYRFAYCKSNGLNYLITLPKGYKNSGSETYPAIIFLHSMAERGSNIQKLIVNESGQGNGLGYYAINDAVGTFITVSPLCPEGAFWPLLSGRLNKLLIHTTEDFRIDTDRVYLTGVSMGGMGTWSFAMDHPEWFAAIAPISGGIYKPFMKDSVDDIKHIPVWVFHDKYDTEIPIEKTTPIVDKLKKSNADIRFTVYQTGNHYIHNSIFNEGKLFKWFLLHSKTADIKQ